MSVEIDTLEVEVRTSAKQASSGISDLTSSLERLKTVAKRRSRTNRSIQAIASANFIYARSGGRQPKVSNLASALSKLQGIQKSSG